MVVVWLNVCLLNDLDAQTKTSRNIYVASETRGELILIDRIYFFNSLKKCIKKYILFISLQGWIHLSGSTQELWNISKPYEVEGLLN